MSLRYGRQSSVLQGTTAAADGPKAKAPYPFPEWINNYLHRSADKISRLWLGIRPEDDRPLADMNFDGKLRKVPEGEELLRDHRVDHLASALGFVRRGMNAFQRHDRTTRAADYLRIHDNPELPRDVRRKFVDHIKKRLLAVWCG